MTAESIKKIVNESHTRLYLAAKIILRQLDSKLIEGAIDPNQAIERLVTFLHYYPVDLIIGEMIAIRNNSKTSENSPCRVTNL